MPQVVIQVGEVRPPSVDAAGRKFGAKVIDGAGNRFTINKAMVGMFIPGHMYQVFYEDKSFQGNQYKEIMSANPVAGLAGAQAHQNVAQMGLPQTLQQPAQGQQAAPRFQKQPANPEDAKRMWVCALLGHFIQAGKLDFNLTDIVEVGRICLEAQELIFNPPPGAANGQMPQRTMSPAYPGGQTNQTDPMNEEIPF